MSQTTVELITDGKIVSADIANNAITTTKIADGAVTAAKLGSSSSLIPIGGIIMWSGSIASIPSGYNLCDGTNGTPNLVNRFVVCAGSTYGVSATGGSANAVVVDHNHGITDSGHNHSVTVPASGNFRVQGNDLNVPTSGNASYSTTSSTTGITINNTGESGVGKNLPPYYALAYIMRIS